MRGLVVVLTALTAHGEDVVNDTITNDTIVPTFVPTPITPLLVTFVPSADPTAVFDVSPTNATVAPTSVPVVPTMVSTAVSSLPPSSKPSVPPSMGPTGGTTPPSVGPTNGTTPPSIVPTGGTTPPPSFGPTDTAASPSISPTEGTAPPSIGPTDGTTPPSLGPTGGTTSLPSIGPTDSTASPSISPRGETASPSIRPTGGATPPSISPTVTTTPPSVCPTRVTTQPSVVPTRVTTPPSMGPTDGAVPPSMCPTGGPTVFPSAQPTNRPSITPSVSTVAGPPSALPSAVPAVAPAMLPSAVPTTPPVALSTGNLPSSRRPTNQAVPTSQAPSTTRSAPTSPASSTIPTAFSTFDPSPLPTDTFLTRTDDVQGETSSGSKKSSGELSSGVVVTLAVVGCVLALVACGLCFVLCGWTREDDVEAQRKFFPAGGSGHSPQSTSWRSRGRGRADGVKQQPSMTAAGRDGDLAPMLGEQGDVTNRMILRPQQPANWSRLLTTGKALVAGLLVAGTAVPGLEGVCNLAVFILYEVEALQNKADDVVAAGERVVKVLEVLKILADNATRLDDDDARGLVERRMGELYDLLEQFSEIVKSFRERGWLRRRWFLYEHGAKLSSLDEEIVRTLDSLRLAYDLSRDRTLTRLLESQRYEMEQAISRQISRLVNAGQTEHDAVLVLADDESATKEVAQAAHVSESEVNLELVAAVASMQTGIDDIKAHVEGLREVVNKKVMRSATKQRKNELLETYEIELDSVDAVPFARGGNSQVHKGTYSGETVVLKRVPLHGYTAAKRARLLADFTDELCIMVNLRHPLVVGFYGVVTKDDPDFLGLCVEYMSGGSLRSKLDDESTQLAWSRRKLWLSQIARGVRYLHSHQIQHRDLKSSNILLSESGTAKVSDFGLSRSEALRTKTTVSGGQGTAAGTAPFMAPELISDNIFTEKSDVYSYGMLVYEVITRERPWDDLSQAQIVMRAALREERPILPAEIYVPPDIVQLMTMCWAHNPDDRPTFADIVRLAFVGSPDDPALVDPFSAESPAHI